jgi:hypothetical protein
MDRKRQGKKHEKRQGKKHERATDEHATDAPVPAAVITDDAQALHALLAAYWAALASTAFLQPHPAPLGITGLSALVYWQDYFANPDHLQPRDIPFVRGKIWS